MKSAVLFSGGKDSTMAAFFSIFQGWDTELVCIKSEEDSYMFHHPNTEFCKYQAESMGLPIHYVQTNNNKELSDLKRELKKLKVDCVVSGAVASEYQKQRIDQIAEELSIRSFSPLWHKNTEILKEILEYLETYIVHIAAEGMDKKFLGKRFDSGMVDYFQKLKIHPFLEGGEGETFVADAPFFKERLQIKKWEYLMGKSSSTAKIAEIKRAKKQSPKT